MNKNLIKLTESDLHRVVNESVKKVLKEAYGTPSEADEKEKYKLTCEYGLCDEQLKHYLDGLREISKGLTIPMKSNKPLNKYEEAIKKHYQSILNIINFWKSQEIQKRTGLQPDSYYDDRHKLSY